MFKKNNITTWNNFLFVCLYSDVFEKIKYKNKIKVQTRIMCVCNEIQLKLFIKNLNVLHSHAHIDNKHSIVEFQN